MKTDVLCVGSATLDNFLVIEQPLSSVKMGDKILVKSLEKHTGGGGTNSAVALSKLGLKVKILTKIGSDHDAEFVVKELKKYHIENICHHRSQKNTDFSILISSTKEKDRVVFVHKGASSDLSPKDFPKPQLKAKWIYLASLLGKSFQVARVIAEEAQKKKINLLFNPSLYLTKKGKDFLHPLLKETKILVLNKEEAQALLRKKLAGERLLLELIKLGPKIVVVTNGAKPLQAYCSKRLYTLYPPKVKVVHTAGAGDAFTSGFLAGLIKNYSLTEALRLGEVNASSVIQSLGTKKGLLTLKEAKNLLKKNKIKIQVKNVRGN